MILMGIALLQLPLMQDGPHSSECSYVNGSELAAVLQAQVPAHKQPPSPSYGATEDCSGGSCELAAGLSA